MVVHLHERLVDEVLELARAPRAAASSSSAMTAFAASSVNGAANTPSRRSTTRVASESSEWLHSIERSMVWWRASTVRGPLPSTPIASARPSRSWAGVSTRHRAAASSMASGMPSSRAQIATTSADVVVA